MDALPPAGRSRDPEDATPSIPGDADARGSESTAAAGAPPRPTRPSSGRRWVVALFLLLLMLGGAAIFALLQTARGQALVLEAALQQIRGALVGTLEVGAVRSGTLLAGATLERVSLTDDMGRPVATMDSVVVRYLPTGLIAGPPRLRSVVLWGLDLRIARYAEGGPLNLSGVLAPGDETTDSAASGPSLVFAHVGVRQGTVSVLTPTSGGTALEVVPGPEGPLERLSFDDVSADLDDAALRIGRPEVFAADLAALSFGSRLRPGDEPLRLREAFGRLSYDERGIGVRDGLFRLPGTLAAGSVRLGPLTEDGAWGIEAELEVEDWGELADLRWVDPRIPDGTFRGGARVALSGGTDATLDDVEIRLPASTVRVSGGVSLRDDRVRLGSLDVTAAPLALARLEPWLERELPLDGWLSGRASFSGPLTDLDVEGRLTLVPVGYGARATTADYMGRVHWGDAPGWTDFEITLDPLNYALASAFVPDLPLTGTGAARLELDGRLSGRVGVVADVRHETPGAPPSRVLARGAVERRDESWLVDLSGDLAPLSLEALTALAPQVEPTGLLRGAVSARGPIERMDVTATLESSAGAAARAGTPIGADLAGLTEGSLADPAGPDAPPPANLVGTANPSGTVDLTGTVDLRDPAREYRMIVQADGVALATLSRRLPEPSEWSGRVAIEGSGLTLDELEGRATLEVYGARVGRVLLDSLTGSVSVIDGVLVADTLFAMLGGATFGGSGTLGLRADRQGAARVAFAAESLHTLRPWIMGDSLLVRDELSTLEQEHLRFLGIEPDTLPSAEEVRMEGAVHGTAELSGSVGALSVHLDATVVGGAFRSDQVDSLRVSLAASELPRATGRWELDAEAFDVHWAGRSFSRVAAAGHMVERAGEGTVRLSRGGTEAYEAAGSFALDTVGGRLDLAEATATIEDQRWYLAHPARIAWAQGTFGVDSMTVRREGDDPMHMVARGTIARGGASDFQLDIDGLHLEWIPVVLQSETLDMEGHADFSAHVSGPAESPTVDLALTVIDPRFRNMRLSRLEATLAYEDLSADVLVEAWDGERVVLTGSGAVPMNLSLRDIESRQIEAPVALRLEADSLDAAVALAYFGTLENVTGSVSASVEVGGTTRDPVPTGSVELQGAAWTIEALGVRHRDVRGTLRLTPEPSMEVEISTSAQGRSEITGTVGLSPFSDPSLDLSIGFERFRAMERRDMAGTISGRMHLGGTYGRPLIEGTVTVDEGTLFVDEFSRAAGVVDLTDPRLLTEGLAVDTTVFMAQPILADVRNPFLDNLRLDVDLIVPRNTWLRSPEMNIEVGGELLVRYDRLEADLVMVGELQALRGTYAVLADTRTFEVDEGIVSFIGTPGVNPSLDIIARTRIRPRQDEPFDVIATITGTLVRPQVTLTSEDGTISQSDLISYLLFNQASADLARGQQVALVESGASLVAGALWSQVGGSITQTLGFDYLAVSVGPTAFTGTERAFGDTQLEVGRYLSDDVYVVVVIRPIADEAVDRFGGVRVEWALTDVYSVEGFIEDRFLRTGIGGLGSQAFGDDQVYGVVLFREWGYN